MKLRIEIEVPINEEALPLLGKRSDKWEDDVISLVNDLVLNGVRNEIQRWNIAQCTRDEDRVVFVGRDPGMRLNFRDNEYSDHAKVFMYDDLHIVFDMLEGD